jgi:hypothetical protein
VLHSRMRAESAGLNGRKSTSQGVCQLTISPSFACVQDERLSEQRAHSVKRKSLSFLTVSSCAFQEHYHQVCVAALHCLSRHGDSKALTEMQPGLGTVPVDPRIIEKEGVFIPLLAGT